MDKKTLAEWLRDIAHHIEEESPLIRDVRLDDAIQRKGWPERLSPSHSTHMDKFYCRNETQRHHPALTSFKQ